MFLSVVYGFFHHDDLLRTLSGGMVKFCEAIQQQFQRRSGAVAEKHRVVELFQEHLDGEIRKLATLAEECRLSVSHFTRSFRRSLGTSAHRYLILHRVEIAKVLLSGTKSSLVEIAAQTGFSDHAAFTRTFLQTSLERLQQNGGANTRAAAFFSKYPNADPLQPHE